MKDPVRRRLVKARQRADSARVDGMFSVVIPMYNVGHYLDETLGSLEAQTLDFSTFDVILVDDGSTDDTVEIAEKWRARYPKVIRIFRQPNGGASSAMNRGLDHARNSWVTFIGSDDVLDRDYFAQVAGVIRRDHADRASMVITRILTLDEASGQVRDVNPMRWRFAAGDRLVDLEAEPQFVHGQGGLIFLRSKVVAEHRLRFDERIHPIFEDVNFVIRYLTTFDRPVLGVASNALYLYRRRAAPVTLSAGSTGNPDTYERPYRYGQLELLQSLTRSHGRVPQWVQNLILVDHYWRLQADRSAISAASGLGPKVYQGFFDLLDDIYAHFDADTLREFATIPNGGENLASLAAHFKGQGLGAVRTVLTGARDGAQRTVYYRYVFTGPQPQERFVLGGQPIDPIFSRTRDLVFFGKVLARQRLLGLPPGTVLVYLDGIRAEVIDGMLVRPDPEPVISSDPALQLSGRAKPWRDLGLRHTKPALQAEWSDERIVVLSAISPAVQETYRDAWLLIDGVDHAGDNAEHLYRHLAAAHPEVNAFFVLSRQSADWDRLAADGFRLVDYGSTEAVQLAKNAAYRISSDASVSVQHVIDRQRFGGVTGQIVFLQHGVIRDDISRWLNPKPISMMVTSTVPEYTSIVGDGALYRYTSKEVKLTGLARHDRLLQLAAANPVAERRRIVISPTWRSYLADIFDRADNPEQAAERFAATEFARSWSDLLSSPELAELARRHDLEIVFLAHLNLRAALPVFDLGPHIRAVTYDDIDVQELHATAAVVITDYSSMVFDSAYAGANVVYYQFDLAEMYGGAHISRPGYFDFETDGFGPVTRTPQETLAAVEAMAAVRFERAEPYESRVRSTFAYWDGHNCERIMQEIQGLGQPKRPAPATSPAPAPIAPVPVRPAEVRLSTTAEDTAQTAWQQAVEAVEACDSARAADRYLAFFQAVDADRPELVSDRGSDPALEEWLLACELARADSWRRLGLLGSANNNLRLVGDRLRARHPAGSTERRRFHLLRGRVKLDQLKYEAALPLLERSAHHPDAGAAGAAPDLAATDVVDEAMRLRGIALEGLGRYAEATRQFTELVTRLDARLADQTGNDQTGTDQTELADRHENAQFRQAWNAEQSGDRALAAQAYGAVLARRERELGPDDPGTEVVRLRQALCAAPDGAGGTWRDGPDQGHLAAMFRAHQELVVPADASVAAGGVDALAGDGAPEGGSVGDDDGDVAEVEHAELG